MSGVRSLLIHNHKKGMRSRELPGSLRTLWRIFICSRMGSRHNPELVVFPSRQCSPGCRKQLWEWYFLKQRSLSKPEMFGRRDWRWKCDLKLPSLRCRWLWTECQRLVQCPYVTWSSCPSQQLKSWKKVILQKPKTALWKCLAVQMFNKYYWVPLISTWQLILRKVRGLFINTLSKNPLAIFSIYQRLDLAHHIYHFIWKLPAGLHHSSPKWPSTTMHMAWGWGWGWQQPELCSHLVLWVSWMSLNRVKVREPLNTKGSMATPLMEEYSFSTKPKTSIMSNPATKESREISG